LPDNKKVRNIGWLHEQLTIDRRVERRVESIVRHYGMTVEDVHVLFSYKIARNNEVYKDSLNRGTTVPILSQQLQDALKPLDEAPNQLQDFPRAFERCARWYYESN
ncbi:19831_t:CDS:1, partial [Rhizophagus irregularis]